MTRFRLIMKGFNNQCDPYLPLRTLQFHSGFEGLDNLFQWIFLTTLLCMCSVGSTRFFLFTVWPVELRPGALATESAQVETGIPGWLSKASLSIAHWRLELELQLPIYQAKFPRRHR